MKKIAKVLSSRITFVVLFLVLQIVILIFATSYFRGQYSLIYSVFTVLGIITMVNIINKNDNPAYKIAWIIVILVLPVFGILLYLMFGKTLLTKAQRIRMVSIQEKYGSYMAELPRLSDELSDTEPDAALQARYLERSASAPLFKNTYTEYLATGEITHQKMLEELAKAEKFIFMEYFILAEGTMLDSVLKILEDRVKHGVDVRIIYDDFGCLFRIPDNFCARLKKRGIKSCVFRRLQPVLSSSINNRDHRKICVIDGNTAFTGGVNIADEYINIYQRCGHWLDCGLMIKGAAVWSFTVMFLTMWEHFNRNSDGNYSKFMPDPEFLRTVQNDGYVQPYSDSPFDEESVGETVYLNIINRAKKYVYICTPYLIVDNEMLTALTTAAKCGVDVRIITPRIPDKGYVHMLSRSYYWHLVQSGVRIYEYSPGFIHSKTFVCDDKYAVCGSINLDYRSLYLHYECAVWMYGSRAVSQIYESYLKTLPECIEITTDWCRKFPWYKKLWQSLLRVFAPLM